MIDIEMLTVLLKELGYLDDSDEDGEKKGHYLLVEKENTVQ